MQFFGLIYLFLLTMIFLYIKMNDSNNTMNFLFGKMEPFEGSYADYLAKKNAIQLDANKGIYIKPTRSFDAIPSSQISVQDSIKQFEAQRNAQLYKNGGDLQLPTGPTNKMKTAPSVANPLIRMAVSNANIFSKNPVPTFSLEDLKNASNEVYTYSNVVPFQEKIFDSKLSSTYSFVPPPINNINDGNAFLPSNEEVALICNKLEPLDCVNSSLCVLSGNKQTNRCVPGNINGPKTDFENVNMDYYYYKGVCSGKCPGNLFNKPYSNDILPSAVTTPTYTTTPNTTPTYTTTPNTTPTYTTTPNTTPNTTPTYTTTPNTTTPNTTPTYTTTPNTTPTYTTTPNTTPTYTTTPNTTPV
jgi:hypothetical protein